LFVKIKRLRWRVIIPLVIVLAVAIAGLCFLSSIHYKISEYFFGNGLVDQAHDFENFGKYKDSFQPLIEEIDSFVSGYPSFFEEYCHDSCDWARISINNDEKCLVYFSNSLPYPDNRVFQRFTEDDWEKVKDFRIAFPPGFSFGEIRVYKSYPDFIMFHADTEKSSRLLVYTNGRRPNKLIDSYWETFEFVRVKKVANCWYDISPEQRKMGDT